MLLLLTQYLQQFYTGFAVFQYLTLRGILGVLTALGLALFGQLVELLLGLDDLFARL